ncbi:hypothetical protein [Actinacidiphila guanduensis]|nr:hypothetical protein [Actinacidiphila guanduensis]
MEAWRTGSEPAKGADMSSKRRRKKKILRKKRANHGSRPTS